MARTADAREPRFLGIEGGGTRTVALLASATGQVLQRFETGPANMKLLNETQLTERFHSIAAAVPAPDAVGIGLSGAWVEADFRKIHAAAAKAWPGIPCHATNDLETALTAAAWVGTEKKTPMVLIVSGTGSGCYGKGAGGKGVKVGAWGHVLGDKGSGYDIGLKALQKVVDHYDHEGHWPELGRRLLRVLQQNEPNDLIDWAQAADKTAIAGLASEVFTAWQHNEKLAADVLATAAASLAQDAAACARKLAKPGAAVRFVLSGSNLVKQQRFAALVGRKLRQRWPKASVAPLRREGVWGAVALAKRLFESNFHGPRLKVRAAKAPAEVVRSAKRSPTEERNPRSMNLDRLPLANAITLMLSEDARVPGKLLTERSRIERLIRQVVRALRRGGRLFYVGAGTSGRLGVLDASECPPTFSTPPDLVQGIVAGGQYALWQSIEGAEDDTAAGARAVEYRGVTRRDVCVGIAASGTTPFVWGALQAARRRGATTALLCFNPFLQIPRALRPTVVIAPNLGPELLTGSTRLKAGTATKLLLNMITTLSMVRLAKVRSNLMIDLNPANVKLWDRATRIVQALTGADYAASRAALERNGWVIKRAIAALTGT